MSKALQNLGISGITQLELRELKAALADAVQEDRRRAKGISTHPDAGLTAATIVISALALRTVALLISRRTKDRRRSVIIEKRTENETVRIELTDSSYDGEAPAPEFLKELGRFFSVDISEFLRTGDTGKSDPN